MNEDSPFEKRVGQAEDRAERRNESLEDRSTERVERAKDLVDTARRDAKSRADDARDASEDRSTIHTNEAEERLSAEIHKLSVTVQVLADRYDTQEELLRRQKDLLERKNQIIKTMRWVLYACAFITALSLVISVVVGILYKEIKETSDCLQRTNDRHDALFVQLLETNKAHRDAQRSLLRTDGPQTAEALEQKRFAYNRSLDANDEAATRLIVQLSEGNDC